MASPHDLLWIMSSGIATDEVELDDFLDRDALIVAYMQGSTTQMTTEDGQTLSVPIYWKGQHRDLLLPLAVCERSWRSAGRRTARMDRPVGGIGSPSEG